MTTPKTPASEGGKKTAGTSKAKQTASNKKAKAASDEEEETAAEPKQPEKQISPEEAKKKKEKEGMFVSLNKYKFKTNVLQSCSSATNSRRASFPVTSHPRRRK